MDKKDTFFTSDEAQKIVGHPIEATIDLPSVPKGTKGFVSKAKRRKGAEWYVEVEWRFPKTSAYNYLHMGRANLIWFPKASLTMKLSKSEYKRVIDVLESGYSEIPAHGDQRYFMLSFGFGVFSIVNLIIMPGFSNVPQFVGIALFIIGLDLTILFARKYSKSKKLPDHLSILKARQESERGT